jgi:two-component system response regulator AtoC
MVENTVVTARVLVVSREMALLRPIWSVGETNSWHLETAASGWEAMERVQSDIAPHLLLLDLPRGDGDSLHILRWLRRLRPDLPVVVVCHPEDASLGKEASRLGAEEVLLRPCDEDQLESAIRKHLDRPCLSIEAEIASDDIERVGEDEFFLSVSPAMHKLRAQAELLGQANVPVLILGERGSGKGVVARLIHKHSVHSGFSFRRVNCAAMPGDLLEIELFGRTNGSAKGSAGEASRTVVGKLAEKGTLLLEEITEMPLGLQARLVEVLHDKQLVQPSQDTPIDAGARILAASSAKPDHALAENKLREDLYYRLSAFTVHVPPLRQRKEEIKALLQYSMHKLARHYGLPPREFTAPVLAACVNHSWPGNLEELEAFVKRYLVAGELVLGEEEPASGSNGNRAHSLHVVKPFAALHQELEANPDGRERKSLKSLLQSVKSEAERNAIAAALEKTAWNRKAAARLLQVSYRTLLYKIDQYHMSASEPGDSALSANALAGFRNESKRNGRAS